MLRPMLKPAAMTLAGLLLAGVASAQTGALQGKVKGEDGKPLVGALVKIVRKDMKGNYPSKTNKKGEYFYMGIPAGGTYQILVFPSGKEEGKPADSVDNIKVHMGDPQEFNFDLSQAAAKNAALTKAIDSGQAPTKELERGMTPEQKAAMDKVMKDRQAAMAKNKALQEAFNEGMNALQAAQAEKFTPDLTPEQRAALVEKQANEYQAAIVGFKKAGEQDPKQQVIWGNMAESYVGLARYKTGADKEQALTLAVENYNKALELKMDDPGMHNNLAIALAQLKKIDECRAELEKAAQLNPTGAGQYYYNLGAILTNTGQNAAAEDAFKKAIELNPDYAEAHYQYAVALSAKMQTAPDGKSIAPPGMKEELEKYLQLTPNGPNAEAAKALMEMIGAKLDVKYVNPDAGKKKKK